MEERKGGGNVGRERRDTDKKIKNTTWDSKEISG